MVAASSANTRLGIFYWALLLHVLYLAAMAVVGVAITRRRLGRLLLP
jgi:hypothetical protein